MVTAGDRYDRWYIADKSSEERGGNILFVVVFINNHIELSFPYYASICK